MESDSSLSLECTATPASLAAILGFVDRACSRFGVSGSLAFDVKLAVEEVCTNVIQHAYGSEEPGPLDLSIADRPDRIEIVVRDRAGAFDPTSVAASDVTSAWDEREAGGLGLHLVRNVVDEMHYTKSEDGFNSLTLVKLKKT